MLRFAWSWLAAPYVVCSVAIASVAVAAALVRGDRVLRLGIIGAAITALPWALCQALCACTANLQLGNGPLELCGPCMLLVLLGASGQLERFRWVALLAGLVGAVLVTLVWVTPWVVPGVQRLASGMLYLAPGPLSVPHVLQLIIWLVVGLAIMRVSSPHGDRKRTRRLLVAIVALTAIGALDTFVLLGYWHSYPMVWLPAAGTGVIGTYLTVRTDLVRPRGIDTGVAIELGAFAASGVAIALLAVLYLESPIALATTASAVWTALTAVAWWFERARPVRMPGARSLEQFVAAVATLDDPAPIAERLSALWLRTLRMPIRRFAQADGNQLIDVPSGSTSPLDGELAAWFVAHAQPLAVSDLATMRLGAMRERLEALGRRHPNALIVPLVDRDELVGLVEADRQTALRDAERALVARSARAAARQLTFVGLSRTAARELQTAREVEIADALRLQAAASRDAVIGRWIVAADYRTASRRAGAAWSSALLSDGRLALLVTEAQAPGVAAALATAALAGAFAAATLPSDEPLGFDELVATMGASSEGVLRGGQSIATFLAILDADRQQVEWACAGHPGAVIVGPDVAEIGEIGELGELGELGRATTTVLGGQVAPDASLAAAQRGTAALPGDARLVVASTGLRGASDEAWLGLLGSAWPGGASALVEHQLQHGQHDEDLLAVVIRCLDRQTPGV